ncbi:hypothetical protein DERP_003318 [Dermatophagoides pteronyssinus]|uniref:Reverse transcriptase zinc-binding domain-containing protein n=1 Tax=Dermatophagoides pteronyssinus TaxID=6956 RepID=A0ABQ8JJ57_DERPT|nr:hypothetical protein DERP_003318 [Dermatophagoides pteronyssinus]
MRLADECSVFQAELLAILQAIQGRITASFFLRSKTGKNVVSCRTLTNAIPLAMENWVHISQNADKTTDACVCGESQTVEHVLLYCPATLSSRTEAESRIGRSISMGMEKADHIHILDYMMKAFKIL